MIDLAKYEGHTPGPWGLSETFIAGKHGMSDRWCCEIVCSNNNLIVAEVPEYRSHAEETPMIEANARLLTDAPLLLATLVAERARYAELVAAGKSAERYLRELADAGFGDYTLSNRLAKALAALGPQS